MTIGYAAITHRSNSFALFATEFTDFESDELLTGKCLLETYRGTNTVPGGVLSGTERSGETLLPLLSASAPSGGPVDRNAIIQLSTLLLEQLADASPQPESLVLQLTGAMTTIDGLSGDELLLKNIRDKHPDLLIAVVFDGCANVTEDLARVATVIDSPGFIPGRDAFETGERIVQSIAAIRADGCAPEIHVETLPLIVPIPAQRSTEQPFRDLLVQVQRIRNLQGVQTVSLFAGYPFTDAEHAGASLVVTGDSTAAIHAVELRDELWARRQEIYVEGSNVEEAVHFAMANREGTVLIADLGDNPDDGAPGDGTTVLWALMDLGVRNATVGAIADEQAVQACFNAGVDAKIDIPVGGRRDTRHGYPIDVRGKVVSLHEGPFELSGPLDRGLTVDAGRLVVLDIEARHEGRVELILSEKPMQITDTALFDHVGIDFRERAIISIKSANDYLPAFESLSSKIFEVITPGITTPDPAFFAFQKVRRPIYPLDQVE